MLNQHQRIILQQFVSFPDPDFSELFDLRAERDALAEELESVREDLASRIEETEDARQLANDQNFRISELQCALADALSWVATEIGGPDKAECNDEFLRLNNIL